MFKLTVKTVRLAFIPHIKYENHLLQTGTWILDPSKNYRRSLTYTI